VLVDTRRAKERYQGRTELLPQESCEVVIIVNLLRQAGHQCVQTLQQEHHTVATSAHAATQHVIKLSNKLFQLLMLVMKLAFLFGNRTEWLRITVPNPANGHNHKPIPSTPHT
jgi:hypothetical protein